MTPQEKAQAKIKEVFDDQCAEINGREYKFIKMAHKQRRKVFAYSSSITPELTKGNLSFLDSNEFVPVERVISESIMFDGMALDKLEQHWEKFPEDYMTLLTTAMAVMSYPFTRGGAGG